MDIYFVRHGQTAGNVAKRHQALTTPLSDMGLEQAKRVALVIKDLQPTHLISSHLIRAIDTAREISYTTGLDIELVHDVEELGRPKYLNGRKHYSAHSILYYLFWFVGLENKKLAGESYKRVQQRVAMVQNMLRQYPDDTKVVVVSHSVFISLFLAHMCRIRGLSILNTMKFVRDIHKIPNTKIIHVKYNSRASENVCSWQQQELET